MSSLYTPTFRHVLDVVRPALRHLQRRFPDVELALQYTSGVETISVLLRHMGHAVCLDIELEERDLPRRLKIAIELGVNALRTNVARP